MSDEYVASSEKREEKLSFTDFLKQGKQRPTTDELIGRCWVLRMRENYGRL